MSCTARSCLRSVKQHCAQQHRGTAAAGARCSAELRCGLTSQTIRQMATDGGPRWVLFGSGGGKKNLEVSPKNHWPVCDRAAGHWPSAPVPVASSSAVAQQPAATCHMLHATATSSSCSYYQLLATTNYSSSCGYCARAAAAAYLGTTKNLLPIAHCPLPIAYCPLHVACAESKGTTPATCAYVYLATTTPAVGACA
jgi:hypothetical protein